MRKNFALAGIQFPEPPAGSKSLYRLSRPAILTCTVGIYLWLALHSDHFTPEENVLDPLNRRLFGPHSRSGLSGEEENFSSL